LKAYWENDNLNRIVIVWCNQAELTEVEKRAVIDATRMAGAKDDYSRKNPIRSCV